MFFLRYLTALLNIHLLILVWFHQIFVDFLDESSKLDFFDFDHFNFEIFLRLQLNLLFFNRINNISLQLTNFIVETSCFELELFGNFRNLNDQKLFALLLLLFDNFYHFLIIFIVLLHLLH